MISVAETVAIIGKTEEKMMSDLALTPRSLGLETDTIATPITLLGEMRVGEIGIGTRKGALAVEETIERGTSTIETGIGEARKRSRRAVDSSE